MDTFTADPIDAVEATSDDSSLSDHEAQFVTNTPRSDEPIDAPLDEPEADTRDDKGRFRHRAQSQRASADDVPTINALTKELRTAEAELFKLKPDAASETPRMRALKRQIAAVKSELSESQPKPVETVREQPRTAAERPTYQPPASRPEPSEDEVGSKYATYAAFTKDQALWVWEQQDLQREAREQQRQAASRESEVIGTHVGRMSAFAEKTPDFGDVIGPLMARVLPPVLINAIVRDDKGPEYVYYLAQHPESVDDFELLTEGKPLTEALVATVQRRLKSEVQRSQAATTGSAAVARPAYIPPRPPNPVRTGPIRTGDDLPGDESSLAEHEKAFNQRRHR